MEHSTDSSSPQELQKKRLVILTSYGPEHVYVANALTRAFDIEAILVHTSVPQPNVKGALRRGLGVFLSKASRTLFLKLARVSKKRQKALRDVLFAGGEQSFDRRDLARDIGNVNSEQAAAELDQLCPDALLIYGTPLVKDHMLHKARDIAFNMHTGISPDYRGTACEIWPIIDGRPDLLGSTLHECTSAVDGGPIFATRKARLQHGDGMYHVFPRNVEVGTELYVEVVRDYLLGQLRGEVQDRSKGVEYRSADLTLWVYLKVRWAVMTGTLRRYIRAQS